MYNDNFITLWCYLKHKSCKYNLISNSIIQSGNSFHFSQPPLLCSFLLLDGTRQAIRDSETYARFFHHSFSTALPPMHMPYSHYRTPRIVAPCIRSNRCMLGFIFICTHIPVLPLMLVAEWREIKKSLNEGRTPGTRHQIADFDSTERQVWFAAAGIEPITSGSAVREATRAHPSFRGVELSYDREKKLELSALNWNVDRFREGFPCVVYDHVTKLKPKDPAGNQIVKC